MKKSLFFTFFLIIPLFVVAQNRQIVLESYNPESVLTEGTFNKEGVTYIVKSSYNLNEKVYKLSKGSTIVLKGGNLNNGTIQLEANTSIIGDKGNNSISNNLKIHLTGPNVNISNLYWNNKKDVALISYSNCDNLVLNNCNVTSTTNNCVKLVADHVKGVIRNVSISNSTFSYKRMGVEVQNHGNNQYKYDGIRIRNCKFVMVDSAPRYGYALSLSGYGRNVVVENNMFDKVSVGVELVGFSNVRIIGNHFDTVISKIIVSSGKREMKDIIVENNKANSFTSKIQLSNTDHVILNKNSFNLSLIEMIGCSNCNITNNIINSNGHYSIILDGGKKKTENNIINNNTINQGHNNWAVFRCYGSHCSNNQFKDNKIHRSSTKGVMFDQIKGAKNNMMK